LGTHWNSQTAVYDYMSSFPETGALDGIRPLIAEKKF